jgi:hypothetical protein
VHLLRVRAGFAVPRFDNRRHDNPSVLAPRALLHGCWGASWVQRHHCDDKLDKFWGESAYAVLIKVKPGCR